MDGRNKWDIEVWCPHLKTYLTKVVKEYLLINQMPWRPLNLEFFVHHNGFFNGNGSLVSSLARFFSLVYIRAIISAKLCLKILQARIQDSRSSWTNHCKEMDISITNNSKFSGLHSILLHKRIFLNNFC